MLRPAQPKRTVKVLFALARGIPVVSADWVLRSCTNEARSRLSRRHLDSMPAFVQLLTPLTKRAACVMCPHVQSSLLASTAYSPFDRLFQAKSPQSTRDRAPLALSGSFLEASRLLPNDDVERSSLVIVTCRGPQAWLSHEDFVTPPPVPAASAQLRGLKVCACTSSPSPSLILGS